MLAYVACQVHPALATGVCQPAIRWIPSTSASGSCLNRNTADSPAVVAAGFSSLRIARFQRAAWPRHSRPFPQYSVTIRPANSANIGNIHLSTPCKMKLEKAVFAVALLFLPSPHLVEDSDGCRLPALSGLLFDQCRGTSTTGSSKRALAHSDAPGRVWSSPSTMNCPLGPGKAGMPGGTEQAPPRKISGGLASQRHHEPTSRVHPIGVGVEQQFAAVQLPQPSQRGPRRRTPRSTPAIPTPP